MNIRKLYYYVLSKAKNRFRKNQSVRTLYKLLRSLGFKTNWYLRMVKDFSENQKKLQVMQKDLEAMAFRLSTIESKLAENRKNRQEENTLNPIKPPR